MQFQKGLKICFHVYHVLIEIDCLLCNILLLFRVLWLLCKLRTNDNVITCLRAGRLFIQQRNSSASSTWCTNASAQTRCNVTPDFEELFLLLAKQWLQLDIGPPTLVTAVITKGRGDTGRKQWVTKYKISYSNDSTSWTFYKDNLDLETKVTILTVE